MSLGVSLLMFGFFVFLECFPALVFISYSRSWTCVLGGMQKGSEKEEKSWNLLEFGDLPLQYACLINLVKAIAF